MCTRSSHVRYLNNPRLKYHSLHYFNSCHFTIDCEPTMGCSPVGVISSMDIALCPVTAQVRVPFPVQPDFFRFFYNRFGCSFRSTQRHFSENICSEDDFRSRLFGTFVVKFLSCLPLLGFSKIKKMNFREPFFWLKFSKR